MVVGDLHIVGILPFPTEDDAPLFVDTYGMDPGELAFQKLQAVAWGLAEVFERHGFVDGDEPVVGTFLDFWGNFARKRQVENFLTLLVSEADNHPLKILIFAYPASGKFSNLRIRANVV